MGAFCDDKLIGLVPEFAVIVFDFDEKVAVIEVARFYVVGEK